ncbi:MAG: glycosyltransferase family 2 protein [Clostridia bacterium]|nr:glycosyltransferase family 2 protein [Clostridia bacterium]
MLLTVITPTYNRAYLLKRLYSSLLAQTERDFEWVVIDDGSDDFTEMLIGGFIGEGKIPVIYKKIEHSGKPQAHNEGVSLARGELTVCVDSDDFLTEDAVAHIRRAWEACEPHNIGLIAPRIDTEGNRLCSPLCDGESVTFDTLYNSRGFSGDTALIFKTDILRENPFPRFDNESFIPEDALYFTLDKYGAMRVTDTPIYITEYLDDGLSRGYLALLRKNPMGTAYSYYVKAMRSGGFFKRIKYATVSESYLKLSGRVAEYERKYPLWLIAPAKLMRPLYMMKKGLK